MALTRSAAESDLVGRVGAQLLTIARFAAPAGSPAYYADLNGPLARALDGFGLSPADRSTVRDSDLARIPATLESRFLQLLELETLESVRTRVVGLPRRQAWDDYQVDRDDLAKSISSLLATKWAEYRRGPAGAGSPAVGQMTPRACNPLDPRPYFPPYPPPRRGGL